MNIPPKIIINILHIALFGPLLILLATLGITRGLNVPVNISLMAIGVVIFGYHTFNLFTKDNKQLYAFHMALGLLVAIAGLAGYLSYNENNTSNPDYVNALYIATGLSGLGAMAFHSYRIYVKTRPEEE